MIQYKTNLNTMSYITYAKSLPNETAASVISSLNENDPPAYFLNYLPSLIFEHLHFHIYNFR